MVTQPEKDAMSTPFLTIGTATRDDPRAYETMVGVYLQHKSLLDKLEFVVIDNSEQVVRDGKLEENKRAKTLEERLSSIPKLRYYRIPGRPSSCLYKEQVFRHAQGRFVLCIDSHVTFEEGALASLIQYLEANPDSSDLIQGPMLRTDGGIAATQQQLYVSEGYKLQDGTHVFDGVVCRGGQLGVWVTDPRGTNPANPAYEIQQQGTFAFACRREAWPSFHPTFTGFGGNETYLMEKFRKRGDKVLCLPSFRVHHSFYLPDGKPYENDHFSRIRNYLIGFDELELPTLTSAVRQHFGKKNPVSTQTALTAFAQYKAGKPIPSPFLPTTSVNGVPTRPASPLNPRKEQTKTAYLQDLSRLGSDPGGAVPFNLYYYLTVQRADKQILEYGSGISTLAMARTGAKVTSIEHSKVWYDKLKPLLAEFPNVTYIHAPLVGEDQWYDWAPKFGELYDVILLDGPPGQDQTKPGRTGALTRLGKQLKAGGQIIMDDVHRERERNMGLQLATELRLVFNEMENGSRKYAVLAPLPRGIGEGPGTELMLIFKSHDFPPCQQCEALARQMNEWGTQGCREKLDDIIADILPRARLWLDEKSPKRYAQALFGEKLTTAAGDIMLTAAIKSQVMEAIKRAEAKIASTQKAGCSKQGCDPANCKNPNGACKT